MEAGETNTPAIIMGEEDETENGTLQAAAGSFECILMPQMQINVYISS